MRANSRTCVVWRCRCCHAAAAAVAAALCGGDVCVCVPGEGKVDPAEWRFLISGQSPRKATAPNPAPEWVNDLMWDELQSLAGLPALAGLETTFKEDVDMVRDLTPTTPRADPGPGLCRAVAPSAGA